MAVAATPANPVLQWAGVAQQAAKKYPAIPVSVLLGLTEVESGGIEGRTSSANAGGLTQFIPGTAQAYGVDVRPGHALSQLEGAAHYLTDLGFAKDPVHALNAYNGAQTIHGQPNPYAGNVLAAAKRYGSLGDLPAATSSGDTAAAGSDAGGSLITGDMRSGALKALLTVAAVIGGAGLVYIGANQTSGGRLHEHVKGAARKGVEVGEVAALA